MKSENPKVFYDKKADVLYIAKSGREEEFIELFPGVNLELNSKGEYIGIEILNASKVLKDVVEPLRKRRMA